MRAVTDRPGPDWFTAGYAEASFAKNLREYVGVPNLRFLQIGAYCGDASEWLMRHVLTHPSSTLLDVDTWGGSAEADHEEINWAAVWEFYRQRMAEYGGAYRIRSTSDQFFIGTNQRFDFIYIDGSHQTHQVLRDAVNADWHIKSGGMIAFDDYQWGAHLRDRPAPAIDAFLRCYEDQYEVLEVGLQVWVRRL